jgi:hypothetical protein
MPGATAIDGLYEDAKAITKTLGAELSLQVVVGDNFRKVLLLAAASYFEHQVSTTVLDFVHEQSGGSELVTNFVKNKAIARQYHTWFSWNDGNANQFFGLFGTDFRTEMISRVKASEELRKGVVAFLELGNERNKLIHQDYATFPLEKTLDEIYALYRSALTFVEQLPASLRDWDKRSRAGSS